MNPSVVRLFSLKPIFVESFKARSTEIVRRHKNSPVNLPPNKVKLRIMLFIIGTKYFTWGAQQTTAPIRCSQCGIVAPFTEKTGMRFLTLFFIIPTIPLSGTKNLIECPNCKARFETE